MELDISRSQIRYFRQRLLLWGAINYRNFPWRNLTNQWHSLVVELMLQRTKAEQVEPVFSEFVQKYPTPADYIANPSDVFEHLGLPQRNLLIKALAKRLVAEQIPHDRDKLLDLPGVGDYIASAFRTFHIGKYDRIIDSNVVRLYGRFFGFETNGETRRKKWFIELADKLTPKKKHREYNYALLDFTAKICTPNPQCNECVLQKKCKYAAKYRLLLQASPDK
ncbi:MAG: DNA glycosylase [Anaerolineae bacterium]|nr:DNA glycosylase [Anaerolineae bacterium]